MSFLYSKDNAIFYHQLNFYFQPLILYKIENELYLKVNAKSTKNLLFFLHTHTNTLYEQLIDIYCVDYIERFNRFEISYNLLSLQLNSRVMVTLSINDRQFIASVSDLFFNAIWYEREVYDMFGLIFDKNNDLRRILTDYGFKGHPLRKDFPLSGFIETRYDDFNKRLRYEKVSISQEYRVFKIYNTLLS